MKKLTLNLDSLQIQSFETEHDQKVRGTVVGEAMGSTRATRCGSECGVCTDLTNCNSREFIDCYC
jgi:hypothetical protein